MNTQALEFVEIVANHPEWMADPEKREMLAKMARRINREAEKDRELDKRVPL